MKTRIAIAVMFCSFGFTGSIHAQAVMTYNVWGSPRHCSTAYEGARRGEAAFMIGYGQLLESRARAAREMEAARRDAFMNRQLTLAAIRAFQMRVASTRPAAPGQPSKIAQLANSTVPLLPPVPRYIDEQGKIAWPRTLLGQKFATARHQLEAVFGQQSYPGAAELSLESYQEADAAIKFMSTELLGRIDRLPTMDYIEARRCMTQLGEQIRKPRMFTNLAVVD